MTIVKSAIHYIKEMFDDVKVLESAIIAALFWWAFILSMPYDTFGSAKVYQTMANIAVEEVWAGLFFVIAVISLYGMITDNLKLLIPGLCISAGLWFFVSAMFAVGDLASTGTGIYFIVALLNSFVVYKVGEQHGC